MLLEFSVENYRSFYEQQVLSLIADESKVEFEAQLIAASNESKLLSTAVIYGANASGKSNLMKATAALRKLILYSAKNSPNQSFEEYDPFQFHEDSEQAPTYFSIDFLLNEIRYHYELGILKDYVLSESLHFYPKGREAKLFSRKKQKFEFGEHLKGQKAV
ncbi:MAG: AAA family ATPase, partial [Bacteroidota bacterium]